MPIAEGFFQNRSGRSRAVNRYPNIKTVTSTVTIIIRVTSNLVACLHEQKAQPHRNHSQDEHSGQPGCEVHEILHGRVGDPASNDCETKFPLGPISIACSPPEQPLESLPSRVCRSGCKEGIKMRKIFFANLYAFFTQEVLYSSGG